MPGPFPGMDPYLERRNVWPDVHSSLIVATRDALQRRFADPRFTTDEHHLPLPGLTLLPAPHDRALGVGKQEGYLLTLAFQGAAGGENFLVQIAWRIRQPSAQPRRRDLRRCAQGMPQPPQNFSSGSFEKP